MKSFPWCRGQAFCMAAKTGDVVYREHVDGMAPGGWPVAWENNGPRRSDRNLWRQSPLKAMRQI